MSINSLLRDEIQNEFEDLRKMELGTEAYKTTVDGLTKLIDRATELDKIEAEARERIFNRDVDMEFRQKQANDDKKDRIAKNIIAVFSVAAPLALTVWGTHKTFKFEEEGTITTTMGRGFINRLFPKK